MTALLLPGPPALQLATDRVRRVSVEGHRARSWEFWRKGPFESNRLRRSNARPGESAKYWFWDLLRVKFNDGSIFGEQPILSLHLSCRQDFKTLLHQVITCCCLASGGPALAVRVISQHCVERASLSHPTLTVFRVPRESSAPPSRETSSPSVAAGRRRVRAVPPRPACR